MMPPMSARLVRTLIVFLIAGVIYAVANRGAIFGYSWEAYASPDGRFSVELPGKPILEEQHGHHADGSPLVYHHVKAKPAAASYYSVAYYERSTTMDSETVIDNVEKATAQRLEALVESQQPLMVDGRTARDIQFRTPKNVTLTERIIVEDDRYYVLIVSTERDPASESQNTQRFFGSFKPSRI